MNDAVRAFMPAFDADFLRDPYPAYHALRAAGALPCKPAAVFPNPLPPEVANRMMVLPEKS